MNYASYRPMADGRQLGDLSPSTFVCLEPGANSLRVSHKRQNKTYPPNLQEVCETQMSCGAKYHPAMGTSRQAVAEALSAMIGEEREFPSVRAMADRLQMHQRTLDRYVKLESDLTLDALDQIAAGLGADPAKLISGAMVEPRSAEYVQASELLARLEPEQLTTVINMIGVMFSDLKQEKITSQRKPPSTKGRRSGVNVPAHTDRGTPWGMEGQGLLNKESINSTKKQKSGGEK